MKSRILSFVIFATGLATAALAGQTFTDGCTSVSFHESLNSVRIQRGQSSLVYTYEMQEDRIQTSNKDIYLVKSEYGDGLVLSAYGHRQLLPNCPVSTKIKPRRIKKDRK